MSLNADTLIDRSHLKGQIAKWRAIAILAVVLAVAFFANQFSSITPSGSHIARVSVEGIILDDVRRDALFTELEEDQNVKAVILRIDSPGGSVVGGEQLYLNVKRLSGKKPVVVVMRSLAASAGYMATLGADRIFARQGTVTGSIGVLMQSAEFTELAKKIGVEPLIIKSGPNKASPNPMEKVTPENIAVMEGVVDDFFNTFVNMVADGRKMERSRVLELADGRIYTGVQALENGLIDALGGEDEAIAWLEAEKNITKGLTITDREPRKPRPANISEFIGKIMGDTGFLQQIRLDGLVSIWQPKPM